MTDAKAHYDKMTKTPLARLIISLGIPTTVSMLVTNIYNMVDTYFVGTLGESAQGATGILFTLQAVIQAFAFMLGQGSGTMVSKALADQDEEEASKYVSTAFFTGLGIGFVLAVGSSRRRTEGCMTMMEARLRSCFCPPDNSVTFW